MDSSHSLLPIHAGYLPPPPRLHILGPDSKGGILRGRILIIYTKYATIMTLYTEKVTIVTDAWGCSPCDKSSFRVRRVNEVSPGSLMVGDLHKITGRKGVIKK